MILIAVSAPSTVAMLTAVGFGFLGAVVDEDGTVNHIQSIFSVYPHRDPYPPSNAQGDAVRRHDDAVLRGTVGAEDDGARVIHFFLSIFSLNNSSKPYHIWQSI